MKKVLVIVAVIFVIILSLYLNIKTNPWNICINEQKGLGRETSEAYKFCADQGY